VRLLLDTHVLLWAALEPGRLSQTARLALASVANVRFVSAVSAWEISQKVGLGRLDLGCPVAEFLAAQVDALWLTPLPLTAGHAVLVSALPLLHRDPADRLLVAQARAESITLVTADGSIRQYDIETLW
jgi:PIN domain nuclease of toxin-antitoxin system